ncbi:MAG TPA: hypothetical protein VGI95_17280 [Caulobacteraceae bacterium]|jgi:hypothetical protein
MAEDDEHRNNGSDTGRDARGRFATGPGNSGKPAGARNRASVAIEQIMDGAAERITRKAVALAARGDVGCIRLIIDRLAPPRRDRPVSIALPPVETAGDHPAAMAALLKAVGDGQLAPAEAESIARLLGEHRAAIETADLESRISALERLAAPARARA